MRRILLLALLAILIYAISQSPGQWAGIVETLGGKLSDAAGGIGVFLADVLG